MAVLQFKSKNLGEKLKDVNQHDRATHGDRSEVVRVKSNRVKSNRVYSQTRDRVIPLSLSAKSVPTGVARCLNTQGTQ